MTKKAKPKKRGVKPGTKRGRYRKNKIIKGLQEALEFAYNPDIKQPIALCGQLEDAITLLENRISNSIAKINSLM